ADEVDLAAVDAALLVDHLEVGVDDLADRAVGGGIARVGVGVADLDLGIARAFVVLLLREYRRGSLRKAGCDGAGEPQRAGYMHHQELPPLLAEMGSNHGVRRTPPS